MIWPALLMALDLPLPKKIYGHGWLVVDGNKISKSFGNYKDPRVYINATSRDSVRYFLLHEMTLGQDGNFSEELFLEKSNSDLSNDLGNLVSRVTAMVSKYNKGVIKKGKSFENYDDDLIQLAKEVPLKVEESMDKLKINDAITEIWKLIDKSNKYIDLSMPWVLGKEGKDDRLNTVLYNLVECIRIIGILLRPYMVDVPGEIFKQIGIDEDITSWDSAKNFGLLKEGTIVTKGNNLFPRVDIKEEIEKMNEQVVEKNEEKEKVEENKKGIITIDELDKVELKVGQIKEVSRIEKSDKLYKLSVDVGEEQPRAIVSGLVEFYTEEELLGKQVVVVTNLKPAKLRGVESNGMLLAAGDYDVVKLLTLDNNKGSLENGSNIH